jgi:hypothetical protein
LLLILRLDGWLSNLMVAVASSSCFTPASTPDWGCAEQLLLHFEAGHLPWQ